MFCALHAVSRHDDEGDRARFARRGQRAREIGDDEGIVTLGRTRERDGVALSETPRDGIDEIHAPLSARLSASRGAAQRRVKRGVSWSAGIASDAGDPVEDLRVGDFEQALEFVDLGVAHGGQIHVGELAHHEVHFSQAPAPGAKQNLSPALVKLRAGEDGPGHEKPSQRLWPNVVTAGLDPPSTQFRCMALDGKERDPFKDERCWGTWMPGQAWP